MGARAYRPDLGRFLRRDPVPGGATSSDYGYVTDPINQFDLSGKICIRMSSNRLVNPFLKRRPSVWPCGFIKYLLEKYDKKRESDVIGHYVTKTGESRAYLKVGDSCSNWPDTGLSYDFDKACRTHDLGYELLRFMDRSLPFDRQRIDELFYQDMKADCSDRNIYTTQKGRCLSNADLMYTAVALNTWNQDSGVP